MSAAPGEDRKEPGSTGRDAGTTPRRVIYLDHHATTPLAPGVLDAMLPWLTTEYGNAASHAHVFGWRAEAAVEQARERIAAAIGAQDPREIVFTSGATESNNLALKGVARARRATHDHLVTVSTEHHSVLDSVAALAREGSDATVLGVDANGLVDPHALEAALGPRSALVSVMLANNEIGVLQPIAEIATRARAHDVPLHSDAAQAAGRVPLDVDALGVDLLSFTAHKLGGPKGIGALYVRRRRPRLAIEPLFHGGGHEWGLRSGTSPVPLIVGFAEALGRAVAGLEAESRRITALRDRLFHALVARPGGVVRNAPGASTLPNNLSVCFDGIEAEALLAAVPEVALSTGSACSSASPEPSHVLRALGLDAARIKGSVRFGLGHTTSAEDIDEAASRVADAVEQLRRARES